MSRPNLKLVNIETGELVEGDCPECGRKDDELAGLQQVIRRQGAQIQHMLRDAEQAARDHELWPVIKELFGFWREQTNHGRSRFTVDRFEVALPFVSRYGEDMARKAIRGIAFDHFSKPNRAGRVERFDWWHDVFKNADRFERCVNRCPREDV